MAQYYIYFKAFHIVGFVSWFAGLFYLVRIFVYHAEADTKPDGIREAFKKEFSLMQRRVFKIICTPGMVITWFCGLMMLYLNPGILQQNWIIIKLVLLALLVVYHFYCRSVIKLQEAGIAKKSSTFYRLLNELPSLFLVTIVLLAVVRDQINFGNLALGIFAFGFILYIFVKLYKKLREKGSDV